MNNQDRFILRFEEGYLDSSRSAAIADREPLCLATFVGVEPSGADAAYGKKLVINRLIREVGDVVSCPTPGCEVKLSKPDLRVREGVCKLASICLKEAWDIRNEPDEESKRLFKSTTEASRKLSGSQNQGFGCPNPLCEFSAGWSIDGTSGSVGACRTETTSDL